MVLELSTRNYLRAIFSSSDIQGGLRWDFHLEELFHLPRGKFDFHLNLTGSSHSCFFSLKWMMMSLFLTSSLFSVNSSYITLPSKMIKSSSFCCCLFRMRNEAWGDLINTTHSLERSSSLKSWSITRMLLIFLTSAIFRSLPWTWSMSRLALVLSFSMYKNNTYFISNLCLEIKRNWIKSLWMSWFNSS